MVTGSIRQKLHSYLEVADDKKVRRCISCLKMTLKNQQWSNTGEFKKELNSRYADYKSGKAKMITAPESKKRIQKISKSGPKK